MQPGTQGASPSALAAVTQQHRLRGLNSRNLFSCSLGGWKSKIRMPSGLACGETSGLGLQIADFSLCVRRGFCCLFLCSGHQALCVRTHPRASCNRI